MNILIVEDEEIIRDGTADFLKAAGYKVYTAKSAEEGLEIFVKYKIDLLLLDIMLPKMTGIEMLEKLRSNSNIPVIILTALNDEQTQVQLFDKYADDYLTKPFSLILLKKRIEAQIRRCAVNKSFWVYGKAKVDFKGFLAFYDEEQVRLTTKEFLLLEFLIKYEGITVTRSQILDNIWSFDNDPYERVIDVYVKNLRKKLNLDCIKTIKGIGYKLETR